LIKIVPIAFFLILVSAISAQSLDLEFNKVYIFKLKNGDLITGIVNNKVEVDEYGKGISVETQLGEAVIFYNQIEEHYLEEDYYRHGHRIYFMPTAEPIGDDHFIGNYELLFLRAGVGILDKISITAGRSIIPTIASREQISNLNMKFTVLKEEYESFEGNFQLAVGGNLAFINHDNRFIHAYSVATFKRKRSRISLALFSKIGSNDLNQASFQENVFDINYANGSVGLSIGLDTKFTHWHGIHFIGELWNSNIAKPQNTGVLLGFRIANTEFGADFGLAFFTAPAVAPFFSFVWTPF
jgi:hypothetical protein